MKNRMMQLSDEGYSSVAEHTNISWQSPSENYSWFRMKSEIKKVFLNEIKNKDEINVIDFGCGDGTDLFTLSLLTPKDKIATFTGVDFSKVAIDFANELAKKRNISNCKFILGDADNILFKNKFDLLISSEVLEHTDNPLIHLKNANRQLKIGGKIIITTPNESHVFKQMFRFMPSFIRRNVKKEQDWCYQRHGIDSLELFHSHISTQRKRQLKKILKESGFKIIKFTRSPLIYGGKWIDERPLLFAGLLFIDGIIPKRFMINLGWDLIVYAEKIKDIKEKKPTNSDKNN